MKKQTKSKNLSTKNFMLKALLLTLIIICIIPFSACGSKGKTIIWSDLILGDKLPEIPDAKGEINYNSTDRLDINILGINENGYNNYIEICKEKGFTTDAETSYSSFTAYNSEGYKIYLSHYSSNNNLSISLDAPMEMSTITWPTGTAGKILPTPKSNIGKFNYEHDDNFSVYISNTTKDEFWEYVTTCSEAGFNVDYSKGDTYYSAYNSEGWYINLDYEGFNIISIYISGPEEETAAPTTAPAEKETKPAATEKPAENKQSDSTGIDSDFKAAMDSYEDFMNKYVDITNKYYTDPTDLDVLSEYTEYVSDYAEMVEKFEKWEDEDLNTAELNYYLEVQTRVTQKLLEINY